MTAKHVQYEYISIMKDSGRHLLGRSAYYIYMLYTTKEFFSQLDVTGKKLQQKDALSEKWT